MSTAVSHKYRVAGHSVQTIPHTSSGVGVSNPVVVSEIRQCPIAVVRGSPVQSFVNVVGGAAVVVRTVEVCDDRRTVLAIANLEGSAPRRVIVIRIGADSIAWIRRQVVDPSFWRVTARVAGRAGLKVFVPGEYGSEFPAYRCLLAADRRQGRNHPDQSSSTQKRLCGFVVGADG